jgi:hypothetical protein
MQKMILYRLPLQEMLLGVVLLKKQPLLFIQIVIGLSVLVGAILISVINTDILIMDTAGVIHIMDGDTLVIMAGEAILTMDITDMGIVIPLHTHTITAEEAHHRMQDRTTTVVTAEITVAEIPVMTETALQTETIHTTPIIETV